MPALPSSLALTSIATGADILSADHRNNYAAIQAAVNGIIAVLGVTAKGSLLVATASGAIAEVTVGADGKVLVADSTQASGVKWGTAGAMTQICDLSLSGAQASFDTNTILGGNIPQTYNHLRLVLLLRGDAAVASVDSRMRWNNDSGANYDFWATDAVSGVGVGGSGSQTQIVVVRAPGSSEARASRFSTAVIDILNYKDGTTADRACEFKGGFYGTSAGNQDVWAGSGAWRSTAAITRLAILPSSGNWAAGSRFTLHGIS